MRVLLFAGLAELIGKRELMLAVGQDSAAGGLDVATLLARLGALEPALAGRNFRVAVNRRYAQSADAVRPGDEVALIPPVSGG